MDYKEKYEMALETIQEILDSGEDSIKMSRLRLRLQSVFPELKEDGDERIIDAIKQGLKCLGWEHINGIRILDMITWLEKQGEQKSAWSEEDEKHYKACLQYFPDMVYYKDYQWLKSLKQRIGG